MKGVYLNASKFSANASALEAMLAGRVAEARESLKEAVIETAVETANALAARTFPTGFAFKLAKDSLLFELTTLYATGGRVFKALSDAGEKSLAGAFYHAYKSGNLSGAARHLRMSRTKWAGVPVGSLDPALHERNRNPNNGHIEVSFPQQIVPVEDLALYQKLAIKRLGKTASGWNACAEQLGGDGNKPRWKGTAMHGPDGGSAGIQQSKQGWLVLMHNKRKLARKHISPGQVRFIVRRAKKDLQQRMVTNAAFRKLRGKRAA